MQISETSSYAQFAAVISSITRTQEGRGEFEKKYAKEIQAEYEKMIEAILFVLNENVKRLQTIQEKAKKKLEGRPVNIVVRAPKPRTLLVGAGLLAAFAGVMTLPSKVMHFFQPAKTEKSLNKHRLLAQINKISNTYVLRTIAPRDIRRLGADISKVKPDRLAKLTYHQFKELTKAQIEALTDAQLEVLSLEMMSENFDLRAVKQVQFTLPRLASLLKKARESGQLEKYTRKGQFLEILLSNAKYDPDVVDTKAKEEEYLGKLRLKRDSEGNLVRKYYNYKPEFANAKIILEDLNDRVKDKNGFKEFNLELLKKLKPEQLLEVESWIYKNADANFFRALSVEQLKSLTIPLRYIRFEVVKELGKEFFGFMTQEQILWLLAYDDVFGRPFEMRMAQVKDKPELLELFKYFQNMITDNHARERMDMEPLPKAKAKTIPKRPRNVIMDYDQEDRVLLPLNNQGE
jgi:hypothetical protein